MTRKFYLHSVSQDDQKVQPKEINLSNVKGQKVLIANGKLIHFNLQNGTKINTPQRNKSTPI